MLDPQVVDQVLDKLEKRNAALHAQAEHKTQDQHSPRAQTTNVPTSSISRQDVATRMEGDRERHKRLRERRWVQPVSLAQNQPLLACFAPDPESHPSQTAAGEELALDIEFDNEWETTSDWNEDDEEAVAEENVLCYPNAAVRITELDKWISKPRHIVTS